MTAQSLPIAADVQLGPQSPPGDLRMKKLFVPIVSFTLGLMVAGAVQAQA